MTTSLRETASRWRRRLLALKPGLTALGAVVVSVLATAGSGFSLVNPTVDIVVKDVQTGDPITSFRWIINLDSSHDDPSLRNPASFSPVIASGDQRSASGILLPDTVDPNRGYLVSVLANDGAGTLNDPDYELGGKHFRLPEDAGVVVVELQPQRLPTATLEARIFWDNASVDGERDEALERPPPDVEQFRVLVSDAFGEVTTDRFGNPICTEYERGSGGEIVLDPDGDPVPVPQTGGVCRPDADGSATIPNLAQSRYRVAVSPPDGSRWIRTSTTDDAAPLAEGARGLRSVEVG